MRPLPPLSDAGHQAVTLELVRLSLPHPADSDRPELLCPIDEDAFTHQLQRDQLRRRAARRRRSR